MKSLQFPSLAIVNLCKEPKSERQIFDEVYVSNTNRSEFLRRVRRLVSDGYLVEIDGKFIATKYLLKGRKY